MLKIKNYLVV